MELNVVEFALEASIAMKTLSSNAINRKTKKPCPTIAEITVHKQLKAVKGWGDLVGLQLQPGERRPAAAAGRNVDDHIKKTDQAHHAKTKATFEPAFVFQIKNKQKTKATFDHHDEVAFVFRIQKTKAATLYNYLKTKAAF